MVEIVANARTDMAAVAFFTQGLLRAVNSDKAPRDIAPVPEAVLHRAGKIATRTKLLPAFADGVRDILSGEDASWLDKTVREFQGYTFRVNAQVLEHLVTVHRILAQAGVAHVFYKGPLQQQRLYGTLFHRPSSDLDILVSSSDFAPAAHLLMREGFAARQNLAPWWRLFVGQEHLFLPDRPDCSVDLHHRLQEPGVQQPRSSAAFLETPDRMRLNHTDVPTIAEPLLPLVCVMNFVKSLSRRRGSIADVGHKVSAAHLVDLYHLLGAGNPASVAAFIERADAHRIGGSARLTLRALSAIFGMPGAKQAAGTAFAQVDDTILHAMVFAPEIIRGWPGARAMLAQSCSGQPFEFAREYGWYTASEAVRKTYRAGRLIRGRSVAGQRA